LHQLDADYFPEIQSPEVLYLWWETGSTFIVRLRVHLTMKQLIFHRFPQHLSTRTFSLNLRGNCWGGGGSRGGGGGEGGLTCNHWSPHSIYYMYYVHSSMKKSPTP
jgi:hypothetical protein